MRPISVSKRRWRGPPWLVCTNRGTATAGSCCTSRDWQDGLETSGSQVEVGTKERAPGPVQEDPAGATCRQHSPFGRGTGGGAACAGGLGPGPCGLADQPGPRFEVGAAPPHRTGADRRGSQTRRPGDLQEPSGRGIGRPPPRLHAARWDGRRRQPGPNTLQDPGGRRSRGCRVRAPRNHETGSRDLDRIHGRRRRFRSGDRTGGRDAAGRARRPLPDLAPATAAPGKTGGLRRPVRRRRRPGEGGLEAGCGVGAGADGRSGCGRRPAGQGDGIDAPATSLPRGPPGGPGIRAGPGCPRSGSQKPAPRRLPLCCCACCRTPPLEPSSAVVSVR